MKGFRPGIVPSLVVAVLVPLMVCLGFWQLSRGEHKRVLMENYAERRVAPPMDSTELVHTSDPAFRPVTLQGQFDVEHSILLDNRQHDGKVGVELLQPFLDHRTGLWLLVNRGWLPWPDRRTPPVFNTPEQPVSLQAWVYVAPGATFQLHADPAGAPGRDWSPPSNRTSSGPNWAATASPMNCANKAAPAPTGPIGRWSPWARKNTSAMPCSGSPWRRHCSACSFISDGTTQGDTMGNTMNPTNTSEAPMAPNRRKGRLQLLLIVLGVVGPMILATGMYKFQFWVPDSRSYHGELIGTGQTRAEIGVQADEQRWQILVTAPQECSVDCRQLVYLARQVQIGLGREASRASHALAVAQPLDVEYDAQLQREYPQLQRYPLDLPAYQKGAQGSGGAQLWIIDPHSNLVLRYDARVKGKDLLNDLRHLLKLSNIG